MLTVIIQARMGSSRLPGKTLMNLAGKPLLGHLIDRVQVSTHVKSVVVATTTRKSDNKIAAYARKRNLPVFRGSEEDVLDRFYQAATLFKADPLVRVTPDCPLHDPQVLDRVITTFLEDDYDYVSNAITPTYPDGLDAEIFTYAALRKAWSEARLPSEREHVTAYMVNHPHLFRLHNVEKEGLDLSHLRWTVDTARDFEFVRRIYAKMKVDRPLFSMDDVLAVLDRHPELLAINQGIDRNEGYAKSLEKDKLVARGSQK